MGVFSPRSSLRIPTIDTNCEVQEQDQQFDFEDSVTPRTSLSLIDIRMKSRDFTNQS